jgi:hypothetical protein
VKVLRIRSSCLISGLILLLAGLPLIAADQAQENSGIRDVTVNPPYIYAGVPWEVLISATIPRDATKANTVFRLLRLDESGPPRVIDESNPSKVVQVSVDGGLFRKSIPFDEPKPTVIKLQLSAERVRGREEISDVFTLRVEPKPDLKAIEASWNEFVKKMVNKDLDGAAQYWTERERESFKKDMNELGMRRASAWYKTVREVKLRILKPGIIDVLFRITLGWGMDRDGIVSFTPEADGVWRIDGSVFSETDS